MCVRQLFADLEHRLLSEWNQIVTREVILVAVRLNFVRRRRRRKEKLFLLRMRWWLIRTTNSAKFAHSSRQSTRARTSLAPFALSFTHRCKCFFISFLFSWRRSLWFSTFALSGLLLFFCRYFFNVSVTPSSGKRILVIRTNSHLNRFAASRNNCR